MPSKKVCASKYGAGTKAYKDCINYRKSTQKADTSAEEEQKRTKRDVVAAAALSGREILPMSALPRVPHYRNPLHYKKKSKKKVKEREKGR
jgi:hypothetical protein